MIPDLDVVGFRFGIHYGDFWGHRGFTHSLLFAALLAAAALVLGFSSGAPAFSRFLLWAYLFLLTASHGVLDAMTDGGLGVAFFAPFTNSRYFFRWTPIRVSPIGISNFLSARGLAVVRSELMWIWLPTAVLAAVVWFAQNRIHTAVTNPPANQP
jgi:inner membrane protein